MQPDKRLAHTTSKRVPSVGLFGPWADHGQTQKGSFVRMIMISTQRKTLYMDLVKNSKTMAVLHLEDV